MVTKVTTDVIDDGDITTAKLADGVLSADATGRGKMADSFITTAKLGDTQVTAGKLASTLDLSGKTLTFPTGGVRAGEVVQVVNVQSGAVATGTTTVPVDDTIPQNTEGDQYMTLSITPTSATNKLKIEVVFYGSHSEATTTLAVALFQDSTANALAVSSDYNATAAATRPIAFTHYMTAGTTSATTFKVRAGGNNAGTTTFNGFSGGRAFGGVAASSITITEIKV